MPRQAKLYIYVVIASGLLVSVTGLWNTPWSHDPLRFGVYLLIAQFASALKLRFPGLTSTMSIAFVLILFGISELTLPETMIMACTGTIVQCLWRAKQRPTAAQVVFSLAAVSISVSIAYQCTAWLRSHYHTGSVSVLMAVATCLYFLSNSLLVAGVLARIHAQPLLSIWEQCYWLAFPYYLLGGAVAGLMAATAQEVGWQLSLLILPIMGMVYLLWRIGMVRWAEPVRVRLARSMVRR